MSKKPRTPPNYVGAAMAAAGATAAIPQAVAKEEFYFISPQNNYVWMPSGEFWVAAAIDKRLGKGTSKWIAKNQAAEQITWAPGEPTFIRNKIVRESGWIEQQDATLFNQYYAPPPGKGDPKQAGPWIEHVKKIYPGDWEHIIAWCAQRAQQPHIKITHALVIGGAMGIGKDVMLDPLVHAVGRWNFKEENPQAILSIFNGYAKAVVLRINEARDLGTSDRFKFYDHMKDLITGTAVEINEKHLKQYHVPNIVGIIITTNYKADGIHLPAEDRRHYVAWSPLTLADYGSEEEHTTYFNELCGWYETGGLDHAAAYLRTLDLEGFNPKAIPLKTRAFWDIANANRAPEDAGISDIIESLHHPDALTIGMLKSLNSGISADTLDWLNDKKNLRAIPHRLERCGYSCANNPNRKDGLWKINGASVVIYAKSSLSEHDKIIAARELAQ